MFSPAVFWRSARVITASITESERSAFRLSKRESRLPSCRRIISLRVVAANESGRKVS